MIHTTAGFMLIDALVALTIFAIASAATVAVMTHATSVAADNSAASQAVAFAQTALEDLRTRAYEDIMSGQEVVTWKGKPFTVVWDVAENDPAPRMKTIVISVTWTQRRETKTYELASIYAQITT